MYHLLGSPATALGVRYPGSLRPRLKRPKRHARLARLSISGNGVPLEVLAEAVAKVSYKGLDLAHLHVTEPGTT